MSHKICLYTVMHQAMSARFSCPQGTLPFRSGRKACPIFLGLKILCKAYIFGSTIMEINSRILPFFETSFKVLSSSAHLLWKSPPVQLQEQCCPKQKPPVVIWSTKQHCIKWEGENCWKSKVVYELISTKLSFLPVQVHIFWFSLGWKVIIVRYKFSVQQRGTEWKGSKWTVF